MADQGFFNPQLEQAAAKNKRISFVVTLNGNASVASATGTTNANIGAQVFLTSGSLTAPTNANFAGLTSTATPSIIGVYLPVGDAKKLGGVTVPVNSIRSASMTAGVVTNKGAVSAIAGNTGICLPSVTTFTQGNDLAFQIALTSAALNVTLTHEFVVDVEYDVV